MTILNYIIFWIVMSLLCVSLLLFVEHTDTHREQRKQYPFKVIILYSLGFWYILIPIAYIDWLENEFRKRRKR